MIDRVGQVWDYAGGVFLVVGSPEIAHLREVMNTDVWYHPCVELSCGEFTVLGETDEAPWEKEIKFQASAVALTVGRERVV